MTLTKEPTTTVETPRDPGPIPPPKELEEEIVLQKLMEEKVRS